MPILCSLAVGKPKTIAQLNGRVMQTSILRTACDQAFLGFTGFEGDGIQYPKHHGGPDRTVCFYPTEHYLNWNSYFKDQLQEPLKYHSFGENLTVTNMLETDISIGDIFQIGTAIVQISEPRIPCMTINHANRSHVLLNAFNEQLKIGYLGRTLQEGLITKNSPIIQLEKDPLKITIAAAYQALRFPDDHHTTLNQLYAHPFLAERYKHACMKALKKLG